MEGEQESGASNVDQMSENNVEHASLLKEIADFFPRFLNTFTNSSTENEIIIISD